MKALDTLTYIHLLNKIVCLMEIVTSMIIMFFTTKKYNEIELHHMLINEPSDFF